MASKKKKKKSFSEQVISGTYESSMTLDKVGSALRSNNKSINKNSNICNEQRNKRNNNKSYSQSKWVAYFLSMQI